MTNDKVKIFVTYKDKHKIIKSDIITPIQTGRAIADEKFEGMIGDDTGDNISKDNPKYNELSAQYWVWKHYEEIGNPEYVGFMHYRRHFLFDNKFKTNSTWLKNSNVYNVKNLSEDYCMNNFSSDKIYSTLEDTDILVLNKYDVKNMGVKSNREEYAKIIPFSHSEIFDKLLDTICDSMPKYCQAAKDLKSSSKKYLCNMFVMKKEVFMEYSMFLFQILSLLDSKIDSSLYCEQEMRFLGYMGEFLLTIFINHNKDRLKVKEVSGYYIENCEENEDLKPVFEDNYVTVAMSSSNDYAPYLSVCLSSLFENSSPNKNYDIVILEKNISQDNKNKLLRLVKTTNISLRFYNCSNFIDNKANIDTIKTHYREECLYRLYSADIFHNFNKIIFTDCDLLFLKDISLLTNIDLEGHPIAVCKDYMMNAMYNIKWADWKDYCSKHLKLKDIYNYYNTGVMIIDIQKFKSKSICSSCIELLESKFLRILEQDALNMVLQDDVKYIPTIWNFMTMQNQMKHWKFLDCMSLSSKNDYLTSRDNIHILHFAATRKPWFYPDEEYAELWWAYARKTPFYEIILKRMCDKDKPTVELLQDLKHYKSNVLKYWKYKILQNFVFGKTRTRYVNKKHIYKAKVAQGKIFK